MEKTKYPKQTLTELQNVYSDSVKDETELKQSYKIVYMEKVKKYKDKVRIYFFDRPNGECLPHSISFFNPEQLMMFIKECANAYLFLKEQRIKPEIQLNIANYKAGVMLPDLLKDIREEQLKRWRK